MKIRTQILALLALPIICQFATVGLLWSTLASVDRSARQEMTAKAVVSTVQDIYGLVGEALLKLTGASFFQASVDIDKSEHYSRLIEEKGATLSKLVANDKEASSTAKQYVFHAKRVVESWSSLLGAYSPGHDKLFLSQFLTSGEYSESAKVLIDSLNEDARKLLEIYRPLAKELRPEAIHQRSNLRSAIVAAVTLNLVLLMVLAIIVNHKTLDRLSTLMKHIKSFAAGKDSLEPLSGTDELAELDQTFVRMSEERMKLDQLRQSIREMVNHDMRSPLTSMNIRLEAIIEMHGHTLSTELIEHLRQVSSEAQRLARLANTLLDIDRLEDGKLDMTIEEISVNQIVEATKAALTAPAARYNIGIDVDLEADLMVFCDSDRTIQIVTNLLSNAIKFSPKNSTITIAGLRSKEEAGWVRIEVIDEGVGVPAEQVNKLFLRFNQLDQPADLKSQGSGLGPIPLL